MATVPDLAAGPRRLAPRPPRSAQVVVVGAGLSGLQAALDVQAAGALCLVLEARGCVGARDADAVFDPARHVRVRALAQRLGLDAAPLEGRDVVEGRGTSEAGCVPGLADDDGRSWTRVTDNLEALCQRVDVNRPAELMPNYGAASVDELVASQGGTPVVRRIACSWTLAVFGRSSHHVSALYFLVHCKSAGGLLHALSDARCVGGRGSQGLRALSRLRRALAARLRPGSVCLSQRVESIDQTGRRCLVATQAGRVFQCAAVILAAPAAQCRALRFAPELSGDKQWLRAAGEAAPAPRVAVGFDRPWWRERGLSGRAVGLDGPVATVAAADGDGRPWLTCLVAGESQASSSEERQQAVLCHLEAIFGDLPPPLVVAELDPETACLAVPAACLRSLEHDQWRPEGSVLFAGAKTSHVSRGHAEGALAAGRRAAEEALWALSPGSEAMPSARL